MDHRKLVRPRLGLALALSVIMVLIMVAEVTAAAPTFSATGACSFCQDGPRPQAQGDQDRGSVVTKGVQFPGVADDSALGRATAAARSCDDCQWTIAPACQAKDPSEDAVCQSAATACAAPAVQYRVYMRRAGEPWTLIDTVCLGPTQRPASVADVGAIVRERVESLLPNADPSFQPVDGGLVNLPTLFASGEPDSIRTDPFDVLGFTVVVTATARWEWRFDEGVSQSFDKPGGQYPNDDVSFTYRDAGTRDVSVTTYWDATFTVDGDGPFQVPGPEISKTAGPLTVPVREAAAELVAG